MSISSTSPNATGNGKPMYDTRVPDAIDNTLFIMAVVGFLVSCVMATYITILVGGIHVLVWLASVIVAFLVGTLMLSRG